MTNRFAARRWTRSWILLTLSVVALCTACPTTGKGTPPPAPIEEVSVKPGINDSFLGEDVDVQDFVERFETESREVARERDTILAAVALEPGLAVADIGAGTGLFLEPMSRAVGARGAVFAVDIAPAMVAHLRERAANEDLGNVSVVLCDERSSRLQPNSVDRVLICDTYHHFEYPRTTLASIVRALRPGGLLVVVDFERIPGVTRPWLLEHVRAGKSVFRAEIEAAGFEFQDEFSAPGLDENYVLRFRRPQE
jgi:SAM-dependent methyltransferase